MLTVVKSRINDIYLGGDFVQRDIKNFEELEDFDLIVNCSGMGAFDLTGDTKLVPVRGQVSSFF